MRRTIRPLLAGLFLMAAGAFGCAKVPPCTVSPVDIEETREDVKILEKDLVAAREQARLLSARLEALKAEYEAKKDQPAKLRKKLDELRKGSGRIETRRGRKKKDEKKKANGEKETA